ncbi:ATP-dependent DNA ligase [Nanoarchaeota archaeon]
MEYLKLVEVYEKLEATTKRLEKTAIIAEFLNNVSAAESRVIVLLLQGKVFPTWDESKLGVASRLALKAISKVTGISQDKIENEWRKKGDLGIVAENLVKRKTQVTLFSSKIMVEKVFNNLVKVASMEGEGTVDRKISLITELLSSASPKEARYVIRTVLEELRVGVGEGSLRDAIIWANFEKEIELEKGKKGYEIKNREKYDEISSVVQHAYDVSNDFGDVAEAVKASGLKGLKNIGMKVGRPLKVMLAIKVKDVEEGFKRCGKPAMFEYKYDGFRIQCHKHNGKITLFTRRLENVTNQFPDVAKFVEKHVKGDSFILDSEAVGLDKNGNYLPFQNISQRIKRKYNIEEMSKKFPVELNVFDVISYNKKNYIGESFSERRKLLEKIITSTKGKLVLSKGKITESQKEAEKFYDASLKEGNEGLMVKKLDAPYKPGARVGFMVKLKPTMETLDLVIVGADWGEGKRAQWLSSFTLACYDEGDFLEVGKVGTGIKEKEEEGVSFAQLTKELKPLIKSQKGRNVTIKPKIVVEITYEEIQKSPTYSSGYALRFPRLVKLRPDRSPKEISTLDTVKKFYSEQ